MPGGSPAQAGTVLRSPGDTEAPCTLEGMAGGGHSKQHCPRGQTYLDHSLLEAALVWAATS